MNELFQPGRILSLLTLSEAGGDEYQAENTLHVQSVTERFGALPIFDCRLPIEFGRTRDMFIAAVESINIARFAAKTFRTALQCFASGVDFAGNKVRVISWIGPFVQKDKVRSTKSHEPKYFDAFKVKSVAGST